MSSTITATGITASGTISGNLVNIGGTTYTAGGYYNYPIQNGRRRLGSILTNRLQNLRSELGGEASRRLREVLKEDIKADNSREAETNSDEDGDTPDFFEGVHEERCMRFEDDETRTSVVPCEFHTIASSMTEFQRLIPEVLGAVDAKFKEHSGVLSEKAKVLNDHETRLTALSKENAELRLENAQLQNQLDAVVSALKAIDTEVQRISVHQQEQPESSKSKKQTKTKSIIPKEARKVLFG